MSSESAAITGEEPGRGGVFGTKYNITEILMGAVMIVFLLVAIGGMSWVIYIYKDAIVKMFR